jgi:glyoxylase-like metal-dependent hydrolase (beta-lactamase superfamily II)/ferredoxin
MADAAKRLRTNVPGDFFVDSTCIDCRTCRWVAPETFDAAGGYSRVWRQPADAHAHLRAEMAVLACPVAAIGTETRHDLGAARAAFPDLVADSVYHCGYHARSSYGAASYLIVRPQGNVLIDSPRFTADLVQRIEALGGVDLMFLTHRDDVADHARFHDHFGCDRILHAADVGRGTADVEQRIDGTAPCALDDEIMLIPAPGHTRGSVCLLYRDRFLFTGDHISWSPTLNRIHASREVCWYDWDELVRSVHRLLDYRFEWLLPGHGFRCAFPASRMGREMRRCLAALDASAA